MWFSTALFNSGRLSRKHMKSEKRGFPVIYFPPNHLQTFPIRCLDDYDYEDGN